MTGTMEKTPASAQAKQRVEYNAQRSLGQWFARVPLLIAIDVADMPVHTVDRRGTCTVRST